MQADRNEASVAQQFALPMHLAQSYPAGGSSARRPIAIIRSTSSANTSAGLRRDLHSALADLVACQGHRPWPQFPAARMVWTFAFSAKPQDHISRRHRRFCPLDANAFDDIVGLVTQPGCIGKQKRDAFKCHRHLDQVARCSGNVRDNRRLTRDQSIQQRRFAAIWRASNDNAQSIAQLLRRWGAR